ncbi:MAG: MerR family transcriptional regulator [Sedimentibacter sp.]|uniref:MerR family transcriptional regulator n=1 Tax=Sedimentibacter sp. TaxID=1960295 RepID=UPI00315823A8
MFQMKIKAMANLMGISISGLRKYEQYGIISPRINKTTNQREYDGMDMGHLFNAKRYRQYNYTMDQTAHLLNETNLDDILLHHLDMGDTLNKEIQYAMRRKERLMEIINFIEEARFDIETFSIRRRPAMWLLPLIEDEKLIEGEAISDNRKKWISDIPSSCVTLVHSYLESNLNVKEFKYAISIYESDAQLWEQERIHQVEVFEEQDCVFTTYLHTSEYEFLDRIEKAVQFIDKNGLYISDKILTRGVLFTNGGKSLYREIWIPIKRKK